MSNAKKFTQEELDQINQLKDGTTLKISEFGQIELELLLVEQRLNSLHEAKESLHKDYVKLQEEERDLVRTLNEKYGAGQVDLSSGEFIPVK
jgi:hypothetical protein|tara:strand:+ start:451 stop:726 length:276 start_codon:yes stop_codon:yes gene_type:complete